MEGAALEELAPAGGAVDDEDGGVILVTDDGVVGTGVAEEKGDVKEGATAEEEVDIIAAEGLEVDVEGKAIVVGVVLVSIPEAEDAGGGGEVGDAGAAGAEELENDVGINEAMMLAGGVIGGELGGGSVNARLGSQGGGDAGASNQEEEEEPKASG